MALRANKELVKKIKASDDELLVEFITNLRKKCEDQIEHMVNIGALDGEVQLLTGEDQRVINKITDELREGGFKYALIEVQNEKRELIGLKLRISVAHLA